MTCLPTNCTLQFLRYDNFLAQHLRIIPTSEFVKFFELKTSTFALQSISKMMFWRWISEVEDMAARSDETSASCVVGIPWYQLVLALMKWLVESLKQQSTPKERESWKMATSTLHLMYSGAGVPHCNLRVDAGWGCCVDTCHGWSSTAPCHNSSTEVLESELHRDT